MRQLTMLLSALLLTLGAQGALSAEVRTPEPGSSERKAISDALRSIIQAELKKPVLFRIDVLKVQDGWAFLRGVPLQKSGRPMDYRETRYQKLIDEGMFDDWICALLNRPMNHWKIVTYALGATDAPFTDWAERYRAPPGIFQ